MKKLKVLAACMASAMLASSMVISSSAASSSFTPGANNFAPLFDFDSTPTDQYKVGDKPGNLSVTGDSIFATGVGESYNLIISNGIKGKGLKLNVTDKAKKDGSFCPVVLNSMLGTKKFPGVPEEYTATDFTFWVDTTKYYDKVQKEKSEKGILMLIQEQDYDAQGKKLGADKITSWQLKSAKDGGCFYIEDGKGGWTQIKANALIDGTLMIPYNYKGWIKVPISNLSHSLTNVSDENGKFDGKQVLQIVLGMGNFESQAGSEIVFDEFGFMMESLNPNKESTTATTTISSSKPNETTQPKNTTESKAKTTDSDVANPKTGSASDVLGLFGIAAIVSAGFVFAAKNKKRDL